MNSPDLKKLVAGFLVLSAVTSVVTLVSLNFIGNGSPSEQALQVEGENGNNPLTTIGKNAFVEKLPANGSQISAQSSGGNTVSVSSNLTQNFAGVFASQMVANNPNGPQLDQSGNPTVLNLPGEDKTAEMIKQALSKTSVAFDDKVSVPTDKIEKSFTPDDVSTYIKQVNEILGQVSSSTKSLLEANQAQTVDGLILSSLAIESAVAKLSSLSVPQPFVALHTTILRFFSNQKNVFNSVADYQTDPLKTIVALQNEKEIINRDLALIKNAASKIDPRALSLNNGHDLSAQAGWQKLYSEIFGIKKAYAQIPGFVVFDPSTWGVGLSQLGQWISSNLAEVNKWIYGTALKIAVNLLINEFQNEVVNWIAGNGNPKFITDWNGFLSNVANKAIGQAVYNILPQVCTGLGPLLRVSLLPVPYANTGVQCTLSQISNNLNNFLTNFRNGRWYVISGGYNSWNAYASVIQPGGNYFGQLIVDQDIVMSEAAKARQASQSQAQASKGFLDQTKCVRWDGPKLQACMDAGGKTWEECQKATCTSEVTQTPGAVVGESLTTSLGWKGNEIVSTTRFESLIAAIVNASINRIMVSGLSALNSAMNPPPTSYANATPAGIINPSSLGNATNNVSGLIASLNQTGVFQNNQNIITADGQWLALKPQVVTSLNQLTGVCSSLSSDISQRIAELNSMATTTQAELNNANAIQNAKNAAATATSTQDISDIINVIQTINVQQISAISSAAQVRLDALKAIQATAQAGSADNCPMVIPSATSVTPPASSDQGG